MTEENGSNGMVMPVQPMGGGYGYGGGYGAYPVAYPAVPVYGGFGGGYNNGGFGFGGDGAWLILFLFAMMGGWGGMGMGGFGGGMGMWPWLMAGQAGINANTNAGFDNAAVGAQLSAIQNSLSNAEVANCNRTIDALQTAYSGQIDALNRSFAAQTAVDNRLDSLDMTLQKCLKKVSNKAKEIFGFTNFEAVGTCAA